MNHKTYEQMVQKHRAEILEAERYIWRHPETGYKEWNTSKYLADIFEKAGYTLTMAGDIPGFYADLDTGRPGPKILILGEMDALEAPSHPEAVDGAAHACGHNMQCAALVGVALALKEPGALDGLCGSIRLMAVPGEELIQIGFREGLRKEGKIRYMGGKVEFLYRGYMDGVDIAFLLHASCMTDYVFDCSDCNGCIVEEATYHGRASHAGGSPHQGINALYAATTGINAINALRETFLDNDHIRVHPILTEGGKSVNIIPAEAQLSTYVRGASMQAIEEASHKVNRALASGALALGAGVHVFARPGYAPLLNDPGLKKVAEACFSEMVGPEKVNFNRPWGCGCTDMGDLSCVIRTMHPHIAGSSGHGHGDDYQVTDPETGCVLGASAMVYLTATLLTDGAAKAKEVLAGPALRYPSKEAYFADIDRFFLDRDLVQYSEGKAEITF